MLSFFYEIQMSLIKSASKTLLHIKSTAKYILLRANPKAQNLEPKTQNPEPLSYLVDRFNIRVAGASTFVFSLPIWPFLFL